MSKDNILFSFTVTRFSSSLQTTVLFIQGQTGCFQIKGNRVSIWHTEGWRGGGGGGGGGGLYPPLHQTLIHSLLIWAIYAKWCEEVISIGGVRIHYNPYNYSRPVPQVFQIPLIDHIRQTKILLFHFLKPVLELDYGNFVDFRQTFHVSNYYFAAVWAGKYALFPFRHYFIHIKCVNLKSGQTVINNCETNPFILEIELEVHKLFFFFHTSQAE